MLGWAKAQLATTQPENGKRECRRKSEKIIEMVYAEIKALFM